MRAWAALQKNLQPAEASELKKLAKQAGKAARLLKFLGNENRLLIMCLLAVRGEEKVGHLVDALELRQSALFQHLARLRPDGLIAVRRQSHTLHYPLPDQRAAQ